MITVFPITKEILYTTVHSVTFMDDATIQEKKSTSKLKLQQTFIVLALFGSATILPRPIFKDFHNKTFRDFLCFPIALTRSIFDLEKCSFFWTGQNFARNWLVMLSVRNAYSAVKTSGVLRGGASGANRCYVLAHCGHTWRNSDPFKKKITFL